MKQLVPFLLLAAGTLPHGASLAIAQTQPQQAAPRQNPAQQPFPKLSAEQQTFLDQVLKVWEQRSQRIERYQCTFRRWEYDPVFGPRDTFKAYSEGLIKYSKPDKGLFKVEKTLHYTPPAAAGKEASYIQRDGELGEYWICDGKSVYEHDFKSKRLIQRELPPYMQGKAIAEGPLPFLFGADAEKIKRRYWIRPLPVPPEIKGEYWLEAFPKTRQDAANYSKVHVIIAQEDFLPKGLVIFDRNFDPYRNPARSTFTFESREFNWSVALQQLNIWHREFFEPSVPFGWKKVIEKYDAPPDSERYAPSGVSSAPATATRPPATSAEAPRR